MSVNSQLKIKPKMHVLSHSLFLYACRPALRAVDLLEARDIPTWGDMPRILSLFLYACRPTLRAVDGHSHLVDMPRILIFYTFPTHSTCLSLS